MDPKTRALIRASNNPYATLYYDAPPEADTMLEAYRARGNPYAKLSSELETSFSGHPERRIIQPSVVAGKTAKADFRNQCTTLFRQYIPKSENGRLRQHHKAFIERNENREASTRFLIVQSLRRYDLGTSGIRAQFNREEGFFSEQKLTSIEAEFDGRP
jgi:hypothetical protein